MDRLEEITNRLVQGKLVATLKLRMVKMAEQINPPNKPTQVAMDVETDNNLRPEGDVQHCPANARMKVARKLSDCSKGAANSSPEVVTGPCFQDDEGHVNVETRPASSRTSGTWSASDIWVGMMLS